MGSPSIEANWPNGCHVVGDRSAVLPRGVLGLAAVVGAATDSPDNTSPFTGVVTRSAPRVADVMLRREEFAAHLSH